MKALYDIAVDVDFEAETCTFTYYRSNTYKPYLQFVIRRVGPHTDMYELYQEETRGVSPAAACSTAPLSASKKKSQP